MHISADVCGGWKSLVKPVTWQNISSCSVLLPEIVMHDDAYIGIRSENNIKCLVHTILGERTKQLDIFCRVTWLYDWLSQFCRCGPYSVLIRSPSLVIPFQLQTCCAQTLLQYQDAFLTPLKLRPHGAIEFWSPLSLWLSLLPNQHSQQFRKWWIIICTAFVWQTNFTVHMVLMTLNMQTQIWTTESKMKCYQNISPFNISEYPISTDEAL